MIASVLLLNEFHRLQPPSSVSEPQSCPHSLDLECCELPIASLNIGLLPRVSFMFHVSVSEKYFLSFLSGIEMGICG